MKKLLLLFSFAVLAACNTEDEPARSESQTYVGTLTVKDNRDATADPFVVEDARFELKPDGNLLNLTMNRIRFAQAMPMAFDITLPALAYADTQGTGVFTLTSTVDPIEPWIGDKSYYPTFRIPEFTASIDGPTLRVRFVCTSDKFSLDHTAAFSGTEQ